jgi:hypothetical protein
VASRNRPDLLKTTPPGALITGGPYEFRFTEATAQRKKKYDGTFSWEIVMIGEGRTTRHGIQQSEILR